MVFRALIGCLALTLTACGPSVPPLAQTFGTPTELATAVLGALERRDEVMLRALALNEREFADHVWPDLPAARPERNMPLSYVWGDLHQKSEASLERLLAQYGGQHFQVVSVRFLGETTQYASYLVRRQTEVTVRNASGGERPLRVFGSVLEKGGRLKVFSYVVDQ